MSAPAAASAQQRKNAENAKRGSSLERAAAQLAQFSRQRSTPLQSRADRDGEEVLVARYFVTFWMYQDQARAFYKDTRTEVAVAGLIGGNFLTNMVQATIDPQNKHHADVFDGLDLFFTIAFTFELLLNMYGFWFWPFWNSAWNIFDFFVVSIALLTSIKVPLPGPFTLLRMLRVFRVFRLFKRVKSLKKIMDSLANAIPGVMNAFVILLLVMCIYSILAVQFYSTWGLNGKLTNEPGKEYDYTTPREQEYGPEYWGNFPKAMYTFFQVLTGESWSEAVVRPLIHTPNALRNLLNAYFFVSFVLVCGMILINVVVAVLLEKMVDNEVPEKVIDWDGSEDETEDDDSKIAPETNHRVSGKLAQLAQGGNNNNNNRYLEREVMDMKKDIDQVKQQVGQLLHVVKELAAASPFPLPNAASTNGGPTPSTAASTPGAAAATAWHSEGGGGGGGGSNGHSVDQTHPGINGLTTIEPPKAPQPPRSPWEEPATLGDLAGARLPGALQVE